MQASDPGSHKNVPDAWRGLRARRIATPVAIGLVLCSLFESSGTGLLLSAALLLYVLRQLRGWPCPRCHEPFAGARVTWFPSKCATCGLRDFADRAEISAPAGNWDPTARTLSKRLRGLVGISQIVAGVLVAIDPIFRGVTGQSLMVSTLSLGSVLGGIWLWRDDERGYRITRTILALELAIIRLPMSSYTVLSGFYVGLFRTMDGPYVELGMKGALVFALSGSPPTLVGVNLFALAMLVLLLEARPMAAVALPRSNEFAQDKESPSDAQ